MWSIVNSLRANEKLRNAQVEGTLHETFFFRHPHELTTSSFMRTRHYFDPFQVFDTSYPRLRLTYAPRLILLEFICHVMTRMQLQRPLRL